MSLEHKASDQNDTLTLPDGRVLGWTVFDGTPNTTETAIKPAMFYFHGFPGSRVEAELIPKDTLQSLNVRCVAIDRPGMGLSSHYASRRVLDWPADVLAVADHLQIQQFYIVAVSGGSPYALTCARSIPRVRKETPGEGRLLRVAIVSGIYPLELGAESMSTDLRMLLRAGAWLPRFITATAVDWLVGRKARSNDPKLLEDFFDKEMSQKSEGERKCLEDERVRQVAIDATRESMRQGGHGVATDLMLYSDVGFRLEDISDGGDGICIWHGKEDQNAPFAMAEKAARVMPRAQFRALDGEGHMSAPIKYLREIVQDLVEG